MLRQRKHPAKAVRYENQKVLEDNQGGILGALWESS